VRGVRNFLMFVRIIVSSVKYRAMIRLRIETSFPSASTC
jgi:hypothetical protein